MCGFSGIINFNKNYKPSIKNMRISLNSILNRGPDKSKIHKIENFGIFGHNRLSIQDLTDAGSQPMISNKNRYCIIYNGEIYNFKEIKEKYLKNINFKSTSDTEVLINLWSLKNVSMFEILDGMFSLAIWDKKKEELILARDNFGEKPLFYQKKDNTIFFSSRLKSLMKLDKNFNRSYNLEAVKLYLQMGYIPNPHCIFQNTFKVEPGTYIKFNKYSEKSYKYFRKSNFYSSNIKSTIKLEEAQEELELLIKKSIKRRLISDVPLGTYLSSGIDSSLIAAIATKYSSNKLMTFNIGFKGYKNDESADAMKISKHLNTQHYFKNYKPNDLIRFLPIFFENYDEPFADHSAFPCLAVSKLAQKKVKVILSGEGGDELFGGYHYYKIMKIFELIKSFKGTSLRKVLKSFDFLSNHNVSLFTKALEYDNPYEIFAFIRSISKDTNILQNSHANINASIYSLFKSEEKNFPKLSYAELGMKLDCLYTLSDDYLQKMDLAAMSYSIENRAPFLSKEIINFSSTLPENFKFDIFKNKKILRNILYKYIPKNFVDKPKKGFGVPMDSWLRNDLKKWSFLILNNEDNYKNLPLDKNKVLKIFKSHTSRKRNYHPILWAIIVLLKFNENIS